MTRNDLQHKIRQVSIFGELKFILGNEYKFTEDKNNMYIIEGCFETPSGIECLTIKINKNEID